MLRPKAIRVEPVEGYKLLIEFNNGEIKLFDLGCKLNHIFYEPLRDLQLFRTVHTNGITVEWDGEIDICPDELYYDSIEADELFKRLRS